MSKVLVCAENDDVYGKDYTYYLGIRPDFIKRYHELEFTTCSQIWNKLSVNPIDILLVFIRSKQSHCWDVVHRVRFGLPPTQPKPSILAIIERQLEEFSEDARSFLAGLHDRSDYPKLKNDVDQNEVSAYYHEFPYLTLYDDCLRSFEWPSRHIVNSTEKILMWREFDSKQIETQISSLLLSNAKEGWSGLSSFPFLRTCYHPIIKVNPPHLPSEQQVLFAVWSWGNKIWLVDTWDKFLQFIADERLQLADEPDLEDILAIFSCFQQRNILREVFDWPDMTPKWKRTLLAKYAKIVRVPTCLQMGEKSQVKFWVINNNSPGGNLEEWVFTQLGTKFDAQSWIREEDFKARVQTEMNRVYFNCYGIPPDFSLP